MRQLESTVISYNGIDLIVKAYKGKPVYVWKAWRYRHKITIECFGVKKEFYFHGSINDYEKKHAYLTTKEIEDAVACIFEDATAYRNTDSQFDFLNSFGYGDCDMSAGIKAYKGCMKTYNKLKVMGISDIDIFEICNMLRDRN